MDFFDHQDRAKRRSGWLFVAFGLAVCAVSCAVYAMVGLVAAYAQRSEGGPDMSMFGHPWVLLGGLGGTALLIVLGSMIRTYELSRGGGASIASRLGGRVVSGDTPSLAERRLLNVVEEMAIASGTPVPPVFVIPNDRINAFAAGFGPDDAVVGVTQGTLNQLSRDELQGVIAHEFSHILHGDCKINLRLMGLLHGVLFIGLAGRTVLSLGIDTAAPSMFHRYGDRKREGAGAISIAFIAAGGVLAAIGYIGVACGRALRAAASRQREFLADASAVQYTRNPDGIGDALRRIGGEGRHKWLRSSAAEEASHMFFSRATAARLGGVLATHPPLGDRIQRVLPRWDGTFLDPRAPEAWAPPRDPERVQRESEAKQRFASAILAGALADAGPASSIDRAREARSSLGGLADTWRAAAETPFGARAVIHALLLSQDPDLREKQIEALRAGSDSDVLQEMSTLLTGLVPRSGQRLVVIELALGGLAQLTPNQYSGFRANVRALIEADGKVDAREWLVQRLVIRVLDRRFGLIPATVRETFTIAGLRDDLVVALSAIAHMSAGSAEAAFGSGLSEIDLPYSVGTPMLLPRERISLRSLDHAFDRLERARPSVKRQILAAMLAAMTEDDAVSAAEAELYRAAAAAMGVPVPLITAGPAPASIESD